MWYFASALGRFIYCFCFIIIIIIIIIIIFMCFVVLLFRQWTNQIYRENTENVREDPPTCVRKYGYMYNIAFVMFILWYRQEYFIDIGTFFSNDT